MSRIRHDICFIMSWAFVKTNTHLIIFVCSIYRCLMRSIWCIATNLEYSTNLVRTFVLAQNNWKFHYFSLYQPIYSVFMEIIFFQTIECAYLLGLAFFVWSKDEWSTFLSFIKFFIHVSLTYQCDGMRQRETTTIISQKQTYLPF